MFYASDCLGHFAQTANISLHRHAIDFFAAGDSDESRRSTPVQQDTQSVKPVRFLRQSFRHNEVNVHIIVLMARTGLKYHKTKNRGYISMIFLPVIAALVAAIQCPVVRLELDYLVHFAVQIALNKVGNDE